MPDWQEILSREGPAVWRTAYRILGNQADADECFQEAFLAALEVSRREHVAHWRALLQRLATARAVDRLRERVRRRSREQAADMSAVAIARIPRKQAQVFSLHCLDD
jgi:RNA polymerase sigma-70 factor, ECF subfamily